MNGQPTVTVCPPDPRLCDWPYPPSQDSDFLWFQFFRNKPSKFNGWRFLDLDSRQRQIDGME